MVAYKVPHATCFSSQFVMSGKHTYLEYPVLLTHEYLYQMQYEVRGSCAAAACLISAKFLALTPG